MELTLWLCFRPFVVLQESGVWFENLRLLLEGDSHLLILLYIKVFEQRTFGKPFGHSRNLSFAIPL
jgi:hypothetical protein